MCKQNQDQKWNNNKIFIYIVENSYVFSNKQQNKLILCYSVFLVISLAWHPLLIFPKERRKLSYQQITAIRKDQKKIVFTIRKRKRFIQISTPLLLTLWIPTTVVVLSRLIQTTALVTNKSLASLPANPLLTVVQKHLALTDYFSYKEQEEVVPAVRWQILILQVFKTCRDVYANLSKSERKQMILNMFTKTITSKTFNANSSNHQSLTIWASCSYSSTTW